MPKAAARTTISTVRDSESGQFVTVKGAGALSGHMLISKKVDLTRPISVPTPGKNWTPKNSHLGKTDISATKR